MPGKSAAQVLGTRGTGLNIGKKKSRKIVDPLGLFKGSPKKPKPTAEEEAIGIRQRSLLDKEIEENEEKFKALARGKLGRSSLLSGAPSTANEAAGGVRRGGGSGAGSLLSGGTPSTGRSPSSGRSSTIASRK